MAPHSRGHRRLGKQGHAPARTGCRQTLSKSPTVRDLATMGCQNYGGKTWMGNRNVHFVVDLEINEGEFDQFAAVAQEMTEGTQAEPGAIVYDWFMSGDRKRCRLLETYSDAEAVRSHVEGRVV